MSLAQLLRGEQLEVETTGDGTRALAKLAAFSPHVVISDLEISGMDGLDLVRRLRAVDEPPEVLALTAFGAMGTAVDALRAGAAGYLVTPVNPEELIVVVERLVRAVDGQRDTKSPRTRTAPPPIGMPEIPGSTLAEIERYAILRTLEAVGGSTSKAAQILGISVRTIQYRLHDYHALGGGGGDDSNE